MRGGNWKVVFVVLSRVIGVIERFFLRRGGFRRSENVFFRNFDRSIDNTDNIVIRFRRIRSIDFNKNLFI